MIILRELQKVVNNTEENTASRLAMNMNKERTPTPAVVRFDKESRGGAGEVEMREKRGVRVRGSTGG